MADQKPQGQPQDQRQDDRQGADKNAKPGSQQNPAKGGSDRTGK